jgi:hypothetical protein
VPAQTHLYPQGHLQTTDAYHLWRVLPAGVAAPAEPTKRMRQLRQSTVEPVFGSLIQHYGLRRTNVRGHAGAHKTMLLAAVAYNLKKLLNYRPTQQVSAAVALARPLLVASIRSWRRNSRPQASTRALEKQLFSKGAVGAEFCNRHSSLWNNRTQVYALLGGGILHSLQLQREAAFVNIGIG